jgi:ATP-dependent protease ClpP protease subunit
MAWIDVPEAPAAYGRRTAQAKAASTTAEAPRWYTISNAADPDEAEVLLYDMIGGWFGIYADEFLAELRQITAPRMRVRINSPGGSVFEGVAIANALRAHPATVTVQVDGIAASIASVIAMAGDRVEMAPNSMLMIHEASGGCYGDTAEMLKMAEVLDLISKNIANAYAARSGTDAAGWREAMRAETWYLPDDAVAAGLADVALSAVPESPNEPEEPEEDDDEEEAAELVEARMRAQFDLAAFGYAGPPQPERPKPTPLTAAQQGEQQVTLTINLGDAIGQDLVAQLRAAVATPVDASAGTPGTGPAEAAAAGAEEPPPVAPAPAAPAEPEPAATSTTWADAVAALTRPKPNPWAEAMKNLTASSSATES